jgi:hypothetical protein
MLPDRPSFDADLVRLISFNPRPHTAGEWLTAIGADLAIHRTAVSVRAVAGAAHRPLLFSY